MNIYAVIGAIALFLTGCASTASSPLTQEEEAALSALPFQLSAGGRATFLSKTLTTSGAKAFAASPEGAWGYGHRYHTLANAKKAAMENCNKNGPNCVIVYSVDNANPPLENGIQLSDNAYDFYAKYSAIDSLKAYAIGYGGESYGAWGGDLEQAKDKALSACSGQMAARTYPDPCVLLDINGDLQDIEQPIRPTLP